MPKIFTSPTQQIGKIGEDIAEKFLVKHGFEIMDRNYTKKWGEIDLVAEKDSRVYFIEVKSVRRDNLRAETRQSLDEYKPEDNMHPWKMKRMGRTIQSYLLDKKIPEDREWQVDLLVVFIDSKNRLARVKVVNDIIL
ncbi:MAG: YraN family protein [Candidatus Paceibacterota bacterium]|jgi:putative endonuclease